MRISNRRAGAFVASAKRSAILVDHLVGQAHDLVNLAAGEIGLGTQAGIAHHVEVGFACQPQRLRDAAPAGVLNVDDQIGVLASVGVQLITEIERRHLGGLGLEESRRLLAPS